MTFFLIKSADSFSLPISFSLTLSLSQRTLPESPPMTASRHTRAGHWCRCKWVPSGDEETRVWPTPEVERTSRNRSNLKAFRYQLNNLILHKLSILGNCMGHWVGGFLNPQMTDCSNYKNNFTNWKNLLNS